MGVKNILMIGAGLIALAACSQQVPDSGAGVGLNGRNAQETARAEREALMRGEYTPDAQTRTAIPDGTTILPAGPAVSSQELADAGLPSAQTAGAGQPQATPVVAGQNPGISDEQSFDAVSGRETIESDAERRARQAEAYQQIAVTDLPDRAGNVGPNIVEYALRAPNNRGQRVFDRSGFMAESRFQRNCAKYRTPDDAQRDFLNRGGPQRDRLGLDPDGDGFACGWDPQPFRAIAGINRQG